MSSAPPGYARLDIAAGFAREFAPIYARMTEGRVAFGFRVEPRHLNPRALAHGGALATFADMQLAALMRSGVLELKVAPTVSLSLDFLSPIREGDWVEGEIALVKRTGRLAFTETVLTVEGAPVARSRAMFAYSDKAPAAEPTRPPLPPFAEAPPPEGFAPYDPGAGFGAYFGPMAVDAQRARIGFRVAPRHINLFGACHGGALAMLADYQLVPLRRAGLVEGPFAPTLSLSMDYLGPARLGDFVAAEAVLVRQTGRYVFTQAILSNAEGPVARSTAIYALSRG